MSGKQVWGCILCVMGAGFFLFAISAWLDYQDTVALMEQMNQMTSSLFGAKRNPFSAASNTSLNELLANFRNRIVIFFALGIATATGGTLLLKKDAH